MPNDRYSVRVNGGVEVPTLDLYGVTDAQERQQRAEQYVEALKGYVEKMEAVHKKVHENSGNESVEYEYSKETVSLEQQIFYWIRCCFHCRHSRF